MPAFMNFADDDNELSGTRPGETLWHQQVRNIKSHHDNGALQNGYLVHVPRTGYRITERGRQHLRGKNLHP